MGCACCSQDNQQSQNNNEKKSDKCYVIIGAGPAGIHMAHLLINKGHKNVIILEKRKDDARNIGKTYTINDEKYNNGVNDYDGTKIVHELGTCYLHPEYFVINKLLKRYDPNNKERPIPSRAVFTDPNDETTKTSFFDWVVSEAERLSYPKEWHWLPDVISGGAAWTADALKYNARHREIFGKQKKNKEHGFVGKPKGYDKDDKTQKLLTMSFLDFLKKEKLEALIPTFVYSQSIQGYGTLDRIPAFYGLFWNTPELIDQVIDLIRQIKGEPNVTCLTKGFGSLWKNIIEQDDINIRYNTTVNSINRNLCLSDESKENKLQIEININNNEVIKCDYLFLAHGLQYKENLNLLSDLQNDEKEVFSSIESHTLCATLIESDVCKSCTTSTDSEAALFWPNHVWDANGDLYGMRNSLRCLLGNDKYKKLVKENKIQKDRLVGYQFISRPPNNDQDPKRLLANIKKRISQLNMPNGKVLEQKCWEYFPTWNVDGIKKGYPWIVKDEMQGKYNNTFYIGSSVCFEAVLCVAEYNNELDHKHNF